MRNNISRWSPLTCDCVIELVAVYDDNNEKILRDPEFLAMNNVCGKHKHLASKVHKSNHHELSKHVMDIIEEAKAVNLKQADDAIAAETSPRRKRQLISCKDTVLRFNSDITEEWNELVTQPHAFDKH